VAEYLNIVLNLQQYFLAAELPMTRDEIIGHLILLKKALLALQVLLHEPHARIFVGHEVETLLLHEVGPQVQLRPVAVEELRGRIYSWAELLLLVWLVVIHCFFVRHRN